VVYKGALFPFKTVLPRRASANIDITRNDS
jgi:hypothetical protein